MALLYCTPFSEADKMSFSKLLVYGLWGGAIMLAIMAIGESSLPGSLAGTAFTDLSIISVFVLIIFDSLFSLGSSSAE